MHWAGVIPNPVDVAQYPFIADKDDFVVFMARFSQVKGADAAIREGIAIARETAVELKAVVQGLQVSTASGDIEGALAVLDGLR